MLATPGARQHGENLQSPYSIAEDLGEWKAKVLAGRAVHCQYYPFLSQPKAIKALAAPGGNAIVKKFCIRGA
jgi:hypothetical protein